MTTRYERDTQLAQAVRYLDLRRYECGCIGFPPGLEGITLMLRCDGTSDDDCDVGIIARSDHGSKTWVSLTVEEKVDLLNEVRQALGDGHRFKALKGLLG